MNIKKLLPLRVLASAVMLGLSVGASAQVLLTAANYAILGGTAISVGGPGPNSIINGNVGLSAAATSNITGFPPGVVSGTTVGGAPAGIISTGGATLQAGNDLITARNALFAMAHVPANDLSNLNLGTLAALRPGVYFSTSASNQTGAIVLDANFQNGVAWVFDFSLGLTTSANSTVTIINAGSNGGSDDGIYWNAATAITIGDNNTILGNYLAGTSVSFTGITTTLGGTGARALAGAAVSFAGPGSLNVTGGPGGGDYDGGLMYNGLGQLVPIPPPVVPPVVVPPVPVVFTGNVILSANGAFVAGSSGVTLVPGTSYPTTTLTIDGVSANGSAPASLTINTANVTLTGTNTYTGGTVVNTGVLNASSTTLPVNGAIALNTSTLNLNQSADGTFGGVISGNGAVIKLGTGALTITGANTYTGGTVINAGTLIATTATLPANGAVAITPLGTLVFNQATDATFGGAITGGGTVQKQGTGALTLAVTTTSPVNVQAGSFYFNTGIGQTTVAAGALLGGNGTITGNLTNNGTVSPGFSPGTINVTGNYAQAAGGKLVVEIASATSFDQLVVSGTATLAGTLQVTTLGGYNPLGHSFTFLTAAGGVSGTFGSLTGIITGSAATAATVSYAPTSATISFTQLPFSGFAQTPNQAAVGTAALAAPALTTALDAIPQAGQIPAALNALSPQGYQIWSEFAFAQATSLADRLLRDERAVMGQDDYYFEAGERRGRARSDSDVGSSRYTNDSGLVGGNHALSSNTTVGAYFAYGKTISGLGSPGSETTVKENTLGVRAAWAQGPLFAEAMLAYGFHDYTATRPIVFPGTAAVASAATSGHQWTTGMTVGEHLTDGRVTLSPFTGLLLSRWSANGFTETGAGAFDAAVRRQTATSVRSQAGLEGRLNLGLLQPHFRAAWLHEFSDGARDIDAAFGTVAYAVRTRRAPRDSALYSAGLDLVFNPRALLYTSYTAQSGGATKVLSEWQVGVSINY